MTLTLHDYQIELRDKAREAVRAAGSVVVQLATGGGKTALATSLMASCAERGLNGNFIVHRQELIDQTMRTFDEFGVPYGVISAGYAANPYNPIQICSKDTLAARIAAGKLLPAPALCVWDECRHAVAAGWQKVFQHFGKAKHVGLDATPSRLDGTGLYPVFQALVQGPSMAWLMDRGYLSRYKLFSPFVPDMSKTATKMGDYARKELSAIMDRPSVTGDIVAHYLQHGQRKRALAFCHSVEASQQLAAQFCAAGVRAVHLDGDTDRGTRRRMVKEFRAGQLDMLTNVDLFGEGFDVPDAKVAILARPTKSLTIHLQQCGRVLRRGEEALIFDHAGNWLRHGLPDKDREWSLHGEKKKRKADVDPSMIGMRRCHSCHIVHKFAPRCPECGHVYDINTRYINHRDGVLKEVPGLRAAAKLPADDEARRAGSVEELAALGAKRGYGDPVDWARKYWIAKVAADWQPME